MAGSGRLIGGRYRITRQLGAGGMGRVWLADDEMLRRRVAIKELALPHGLAVDERAVLRELTLREAQAAARVGHPNVIRVFDVLHSEDRPWIVMEYVPSRSLLDLIVEAGPLPLDRAAGIGLAVLSALDAARRSGVLHHDVKPSNVLIADDGRVVLTDFGSAATDDGAGALTAAGTVLGSPDYIAPERLANGVCTAQADLWSLGATLYHAVEGRPPYTRESTAAVLWALSHRPPDPVRRAGPFTPVLDGLLQRDPAARMAPAEVAYRMRQFTQVRDGGNRRPSGRRSAAAVGRAAVPAARPRRAATGRRVPWRVSALVAVLAVVAAVTVPVAAGVGRSRTTTPSAAAPSGLFAIPPGFTWWVDRSGFRVAVPRAWLNSRDADAVLFSAPAGQPTLRIGVRAPGASDPVTALVDAERANRLAAYRRIRIEALPRSSDAVWEYTFTDPRAGPVHGLERLVALGGSSYVIAWHTPTAAWASHLEDLAVVLESFRPLRGA
jgi:serine/threonine protein kinase